jgi:hypothetical protein
MRAELHYKTVHQRSWCRDEVLRRVLTDVANELREQGVLDEEESFIDATFAINGQGWRRGDRTDQARERPENQGDCGSAWFAATRAFERHRTLQW